MIEFCVRRRKLHGQSLWWICHTVQGRVVPYADIYAPTGYGYKKKALAEQNARALEQEVPGDAGMDAAPRMG